MTDNTNPNPPQPGVAPKPSMLSKIGGGFSWWIGSLTGKPQPRKQPVPQAPSVPVAAETPQAPVTQPVSTGPAQNQIPQSGASAGTQSATSTSDSVMEDLAKIKKIIGKVSGDVSKSVGPAVSKGVSTSSQKATAFGKSNKKFLGTVLKIFFIILLLMTLGFIGLKFLNKAPEIIKEPEITKAPSATSTPTPIVFNPIKPSVYADDPVILKLEQDIDVLVREIGGTNIKETQLNPPLLDYNITF